MFCPVCGTASKDEQKYCRACGLNLQSILPHVAQHLHLAAPPSKIRKALNKVEYLGMFLGGSGIAVMIGTAIFALLALAFLGPEARRMSPLWSSIFGVGVLMLLKGAFLWAIPWITKEFFPLHKTNTLSAAKTKELPAELVTEPVASITEHTTRHLESTPIPQRERVMN
ncbi:MAG: zinc ribbon domain-containing protein [Blastocatellia bacterium]